MATLHTERLTLRLLTMDDMSDVFKIFSDERAMTFIPYLPHQTIDETRAHFEPKLTCEPVFQWAVCLKGQNKVIGILNLFGDARVPGMGYILHPDYWGQSITVEACHALLDYGFANLGYDRMELWIDDSNQPSMRVAQKLGFQVKGRLPLKYTHQEADHIMLVWGMLREDWFSESSKSSATQSVFYGVEPVLGVHDVVATAEYYRDKLGFHIDFLYGYPAVHGAVSRGEWTGSMAVIQLTKVPAEQDIVPVGNLYIHVNSSLDNIFEQYRANGVSIVAEPEDKPWGRREFSIADLNGHWLVFSCYV